MSKHLTLSFLLLFFFLLLCDPSYGRFITHSPYFSLSSDHLISDGVQQLRGPPYLALNLSASSFSAGSTCEQTYGFLSCTTTVLGNIFLIVVYDYLMFLSATYLANGSEVLLEILGPGIVGGLFLPILGAVPDAMLILEIFSGDNYVAWSRSITIALSVKNKVAFIDGSIRPPHPSQSILYIAWMRANNLVLSWLINSISKDIRNSLLYVNSALDLWNELKTRYLRSDGPRVFHLEKSLSCINQGSSSITEYFSAFKALWDEYVSFRPFPTCTCGKMSSCTCDIFPFLLQRQQSDYVLKFLVGLNESYASIRSQLLLSIPLPTMAKVFSLLLQEESQRQLTNSVSNETHALMVKQFSTPAANQYKFSKEKAKKSSLHCTHCGYNGHTIDKCFQLHGYPPGWTGPKGKRNHPAAHAAISANEICDQNKDESHMVSLTSEEFNKLLALVNSLQPSRPSSNIQNTLACNLVTSAQFSGKFFCNSVSVIPDHSWILDTGATDHMICSPNFYCFPPKPINISINLPNGQIIPATHIGTICISNTLFLKNVLCVPSFSFNLLSVSKLTQQSNLSLSFFGTHCLLQDQSQKRMIGIAFEKQGLYHFVPSCTTSKPNSVHFSAVSQKSLDLWHYRLGHVSFSRLSSLKHLDSSIFMDCQHICDICPLAKQKRLPFPVSYTKSNKIFDLIHCDIWGPFATISYSGYKYFLTIVDDFTRCTWVYMLKAKSEVPFLLKTFCILIKTQFNVAVKTIRSDNGPEFFLTDFYNENGILHQKSCVETPQQNGTVERKHQHLLSTARALMFQSNIPLSFWSDCVLTAAHIINRIPTPLLNNKTPYEMLFNKTPKLSHLKVFGCLCFASTLHNHRHKFDPRAVKCIFLGYPSNVKGYKVMDINTNKVFISRNVKFYENILPFTDTPSNPQSHTFLFPPSENNFYVSTNPIVLPNSSISSNSTNDNLHSYTNQDVSISQNNHISSDLPQLRKSTRIRKPSVILQDYYCSQVTSNATHSTSSNDGYSKVSGLSGSTETAQSQVSVGMGLLAGSTVTLLTIIWGTCVIVGKCDLVDDVAQDAQDTKGYNLTESGVSTDIWTSYTARIMVISAIPFIIVQIPQGLINSTSGRHLAVWIALIVSLLLLISYCLYQVLQPWIQRRKISYVKHKRVVLGLLRHLRDRAGWRLLRDNGEPNEEGIKRLFSDVVDTNGDGNISYSELRTLIVSIQFEEIDPSKDHDAVKRLMRDFDTSQDHRIDETEFVEVISNWLKRARRIQTASQNPSLKFLDDIDQDTYREHDLLDVGDESDEESEDAGGSRWTSIKAVLLLLLGTLIAIAFADPLVDAIDNFADATSIPSFFVSFIALPLATNSREAVSTITSASHDKRITASLTFSELYGVVTVNNLLCISVFLALVNIRGLTWDFSSEVLVIVIVCVVVGGFASFRTHFPLWTALVAFLLYPFSLALIYVLHYVLGWS